MFISVRTAVHRHAPFLASAELEQVRLCTRLIEKFIDMHLFSPRQSSNKFGSALGLSKRFVCRKYRHLSAGCKIARIRKNRVAAIFFAKKEAGIKKYGYICTLQNRGEMPEWSIGPHSKCGVRVTVPGVRIPLSPQYRLEISELRNLRTV